MKNYVDTFKKQLQELPESGYKNQLIKYGEDVAKDLVNKSIIKLIADIKITDKNIEYVVDELKENYTEKIRPVRIELSYDLGIYEELIYKNSEKTRENIEKSTKKACELINNNFMNFICNENVKELSLKKDIILSGTQSRIILVGNGVFGKDSHLKYAEDNKDLKFIGNHGSSLVYHSMFIPPRTLYSIELNKEKLIEYVVKNPLTIFRNKYVHLSGIRMLNPDVITKYRLL